MIVDCSKIDSSLGPCETRILAFNGRSLLGPGLELERPRPPAKRTQTYRSERQKGSHPRPAFRRTSQSFAPARSIILFCLLETHHPDGMYQDSTDKSYAQSFESASSTLLDANERHREIGSESENERSRSIAHQQIQSQPPSTLSHMTRSRFLALLAVCTMSVGSHL